MVRHTIWPEWGLLSIYIMYIKLFELMWIVLHVLCAVERSFCYGGSIGITCDNEIEIVNVFYGDLGGVDNERRCQPRIISEYDCRTQVEDDYLETVRRQCDGHKSCGNIATEQSHKSYCNPEWPNEYSEYVTVVYKCVEVQGRSINHLYTILITKR